MAKVQETRSGAGVSSDSDLSGALQGAGHQAVRYLPGGDESRARAGGASPAAERGGDGDGGERMMGPGGTSKATLDAVAKRKENFLKVFRKKAGIVTATCQAVGIGRSIYYDWLHDDKAFAASIDDINEQMLDFAESKLQGAIEAGASWAVCFFLKCKGKARGWVERQELTGPSGGPVTFRVVYEEMKTGEADGS
jgi:hypothetical protein